MDMPMGRVTIRELRRMGVSDEDIAIARLTQAAQKRTGAPVQPIGVIVGAVKERRQNASQPVDMTERALRRRGTYDQAALLLDQQALQEKSPERAAKARELAQGAKDLSASTQLEFDFFGGGNMSIAFQFQDAMTERLFSQAKTPAQAKEALTVLWTICRHLGWQSYECTRTAADLCAITRTDKSDMSRALNLLESIGAIRRVKKGRQKVITVTPEGAYRGNINNHAQAVERYKLDVIDGGKE